MTPNNPAAGTYTIRIDGFNVPEGTTSFDYRDVFFSPALGNLAVLDATTPLPLRGTMTVSGTVTAQLPPALAGALRADERRQHRGDRRGERLGSDRGGGAVTLRG